MAEQEGITVRKAEKFSEWFHEVVEKAGIVDQRFPMQGFLVYNWYGWEIHENYIRFLEEMYRKIGYKKFYFPALIPESLISREANHIKGFHDQVFWVTQTGLKNMGEKAALRPTSETVMYEMMKLWIRSYKDLPMKVFQSTSVYRYETKHTRPLIRDREILWNEAHSAHASLEEIKKHVKEVVEVYSKLYEYCAVPVKFIDVVTGLFAGAVQAIESYSVFPDGKILEMGSVNNLGQRFSKAFDIKFLKENSTHEHVYQGSYGVSERILAAIVALHGDDKGLILPPNVAPIQLVIVPILSKDEKQNGKILKYCRDVEKKLSGSVRVFTDSDKEKTPGWKFNHYEMIGVPLRAEVGERELKQKSLTLVRRDNSKKSNLQLTKIKTVSQILQEIQDELYERAKKEQEKKTFTATNLSELKQILLSKGGLVKTNWCGDNECAQKVKEETDGGELIGPEYGKNEAPRGICVACAKKANRIVYVGNSY